MRVEGGDLKRCEGGREIERERESGRKGGREVECIIRGGTVSEH